MALSDDDLAQVKALVQNSVVAAVAAAASDPRNQMRSTSRTTAEIGSPEFAEDRTQINSLNNKEIFAREATRFDKMYFASFDHSNDLNARLVKSFDSLLGTQDKLNDAFFRVMAQNARWQDDNAYVTRYDLSNPNTLGTSDVVRGAVDPQNRAIDTATAQSTLNNTTMQTAIEAAVANALNGTIPTLEAAIGAAVAAALTNVPKAAQASPTSPTGA